jgi:hypothetical protein
MKKQETRPSFPVCSTFFLVTIASLSILGPSTAGQSSDTVLRVGIVGDQYGSRTNSPDPSQVLQDGLTLLKKQNAQMILHLGDLIEGVGQPPAEYAARFARMAAILDQARIPWYLVPGDHDVNPKEFTPNSSDRSIEKLFYSSYKPKRPELSSGLYYSFDVRGYHFIALNSFEHLCTDVRWGDAFLAKLTDGQFSWLKQDLEKHRSSHGIVVFTHQPLWYNVAAWQPVHQLLRQYPVRIVVAGHFHYSQDEGELDRIRYVVVGATGASVKRGSPETGNAQVVSTLVLRGKKIDLKLLPIGSDSPKNFATRQDMDRIQALDQALDDLADWQYEPGDALCLNNGVVTSKQDGSPGAIRLRAIGNPIDIPVRFSASVEADGLPPTPGKFARGFCRELVRQDCVVDPGVTTKIANISAVEFRWPSMTEVPADQVVPPLSPLWEWLIPPKGFNPPEGTELRVRVRYSFPPDSGAKYVEQELSMVLNGCTQASSPK